MSSMTSDYVTGQGDPLPYLRRIAEAGFSEVHWCHEWTSDHLYTAEETQQLLSRFNELGLVMNSVHASNGRVGDAWWVTGDEALRNAGRTVMENRIEFCERFECDSLVIHIRHQTEGDEAAAMRKTLHANLATLEPFAKKRNVRLAVENLFAGDNVQENSSILEDLLNEYDPEFIGLCYDSGHGNLIGSQEKALDLLEKWKHRLIAVHLHDNDGASDQHRIPFTGTVDWERLTRIMAESSYTKCPNLEVAVRNSPMADEPQFLAECKKASTRLQEMIQANETT